MNVSMNSVGAANVSNVMAGNIQETSQPIQAQFCGHQATITFGEISHVANPQEALQEAGRRADGTVFSLLQNAKVSFGS